MHCRRKCGREAIRALTLIYSLIIILWTAGCSLTDTPTGRQGDGEKVSAKIVLSCPDSRSGSGSAGLGGLAGGGLTGGDLTGVSPAADGLGTKSEDPDEDLVSDLNIFIFNARGMLEESTWISASGLCADGSSGSFGNGGTGGTEYVYETTLLRGGRYSVYACANIGYKLNVGTIEELETYRYYLVYPDDWRIGIPMCGKTEDVTIPADGRVSVPMERMIAKVTLQIDRSKLSDGVEFHVTQARVGGCPRSALLFRDSRTEDEDDIFGLGFSKKDGSAAELNRDAGFGKSGTVSVYLMENLHGDLLREDVEDKDKVLDPDDPLSRICSYIEIMADYRSDSLFSSPGKPLTYRFYLGENNRNFDVRRNCHYRVCVTPRNDGLDGDGWRVDKSGIGSYIKSIELSYSSLQMSYPGETALLIPYITPEDAADRTLIWESDNSSVAEVSDTGLVTARGEGTCTITCSSTDGGGAYAECPVTVKYKDFWLKVYPGNLMHGYVGEELRVWCEYFPPNAEFDIGVEELEYDKSRGIYDYQIDADGKGVTLYLKSQGGGLLYVSAGEPINESEMIVLVVD